MQTDKHDLVFDNNKFTESLANLDYSNWVFKYDEISDVLYFAPRDMQITEEHQLVPAGDTEISAYVNTSSEAVAILVDGFRSTYLEENPEFQNLYALLTKKNYNALDYKLYARALAYDMGRTGRQLAGFPV